MKFSNSRIRENETRNPEKKNFRIARNHFSDSRNRGTKPFLHEDLVHTLVHLLYFYLEVLVHVYISLHTTNIIIYHRHHHHQGRRRRSLPIGAARPIRRCSGLARRQPCHCPGSPTADIPPSGHRPADRRQQICRVVLLTRRRQQHLGAVRVIC